MCRVFVDESEDVSINHSNDPSLDHKLLHIVAYACLPCKPFFVSYDGVGKVWVCGICCPFLYHLCPM